MWHRFASGKNRIQQKDRTEEKLMNWRISFVPILLLWFGSLAYAQEKPTIQRATVKDTAVDSGPEMFTTYCAVCHGPNGKGNGPAATALKKQPADLTQLSKKNGGKFPDMRVAQFIEGQEVMASHGSRDMPIWGNIFRGMGAVGGGDGATKLRIHNLTKYVETLQEK
jgi:mono/diheme cytochrome c family protein